MVFMPHWPLNIANLPADPELTRIKNILKLLGNPQDKLPPVIHVAGTNGKGSVCNFLKSIFIASGYKVHLYSSPHLIRFNERIIVANEEISDDLLFNEIEEVRILTDGKIRANLFETITAVALNIFSKISADIVIIECGMGGRTDPTNVFSEVFFSIICPISFDHTEYLGEDIRLISLEKADIIKENSNVIVASQPKEALEMIELVANKRNANMFIYDKNFTFDIPEKEEILEMLDSPNEPGSNILEYSKYFSFIDLDDRQILYFTKPGNMHGYHQLSNASLSIEFSLKQALFDIPESAISSAISNSKFTARLQNITQELIATHHLNDNHIAYIDGAHNTHGALIVSQWLASLNNATYIDKNIKNIIIVGRTADRDNKSFLQIFADSKLIHKVISVRVKNEPNPEKSEVITKDFKNNPLFLNYDNLESSLEFIKDSYKENSVRIIICGSLYLFRDFVAITQNKKFI